MSRTALTVCARKAFYGAPALAKLDRCRGFELLASLPGRRPEGVLEARTRTWSTLRACFATRTDERVIRGARQTGVVAELQAREVFGCGRIRRSQQARNGGSPCSLIRPARATHRYGT